MQAKALPSGAKVGKSGPDIFEQVSILFVRFIQRDMTERPRFAVAPGKGVEWHVAVYIGQAPPNLERHYREHAIVKSTQVDPVVTDSQGQISYKAAVSTSASAALVALRDELLEALRLRLMSDLSVYERVTGGAYDAGGAKALPSPQGGEPAE